MTEIRVSIIMPVYNAEKYLRETLESVKNQSFKDYELIAVNDGSTDSSEVILSEYINDCNMKLINQKNSGVSAARNNGIANASGEYVCFLDSDDILHRDYLSVLYSNACKNDGDIIFCEYEPFYGCFKEKSINESIKCEELYQIHKQETFDYVMEIGYATSPCIKLYRTILIKKHGIKFNEKSSYGEDMFFNWKAFLVAKKVNHVHQVLYGYRQNVGSITTKYHENLFEKYMEEYETLRAFGKECGADMQLLCKSIKLNLLKVVPSFLRMNIRSRKAIIKKYTYVKALVDRNEIQDALHMWKNEHSKENGVLRDMLVRKYFRVFLQGIQMEYRFRLGRVINNFRYKEKR